LAGVLGRLSCRLLGSALRLLSRPLRFLDLLAHLLTDLCAEIGLALLSCDGWFWHWHRLRMHCERASGVAATAHLNSLRQT
jgi:hypothetical protein